MVGGVVSWTVTVNVQVAALPALSVAVMVTVVVPIANCDPLGGENVITGAGSQTSVAVPM